MPQQNTCGGITRRNSLSHVMTMYAPPRGYQRRKLNEGLFLNE